MKGNIKTLNELLRGEHMAIKGYETVMTTLEDKNLKYQLNGILEDHKRHAMEIKDRIYQLGGEPEESTGFVGLMSEMKLKLEGMIKKDRVMLEELYNGEKLGIDSAKETIKGDLDIDSEKMIIEMLQTDERHLLELNRLISQKEKRE